MKNTNKKQSLKSTRSASTDAEQKRAVGADAEQKRAAGADAELKRSVGADAEQKRAVGADAELKRSVGADAEQKRTVGADAEQKRAVGADAELKRGAGADVEQKRTAGADAKLKRAAGADAKQRRAVGADAELKRSVGADAKQKRAVGADAELKRAVGADAERRRSAGVKPNSTKQGRTVAESMEEETVYAEYIREEVIDIFDKRTALKRKEVLDHLPPESYLRPRHDRLAKWFTTLGKNLVKDMPDFLEFLNAPMRQDLMVFLTNPPERTYEMWALDPAVDDEALLDFSANHKKITFSPALESLRDPTQTYQTLDPLPPVCQMLNNVLHNLSIYAYLAAHRAKDVDAFACACKFMQAFNVLQKKSQSPDASFSPAEAEALLDDLEAAQSELWRRIDYKALMPWPEICAIARQNMARAEEEAQS